MIEYGNADQPDFNAMANELENPLTMFRGLASYDKAQFYRNISQGVDPYGRPQPPLTEPYRSNKKSNQPILVKSRKMIRSYTQIVTVGQYKVMITDPKAIFHQDGTKNKDGSIRMVRRLLLPIQELGLPIATQNKLLSLTIEYFERAERAARK